MEHIERSAMVAAAPEVAYALLARPESLCKLLPGRASLAETEILDATSWRCHWSRQFMSAYFEGWTTATTDAANRSVTLKSTGGLVSNCVWTLAPTDGGTAVTLQADMRLPMPLMRKHALGDLREGVVRDVEQMLANFVALLTPEPAFQRAEAQDGEPQKT